MPLHGCQSYSEGPKIENILSMESLLEAISPENIKSLSLLEKKIIKTVFHEFVYSTKKITFKNLTDSGWC